MKFADIISINDSDNPFCIGDPCFTKLPDGTLLAGHTLQPKEGWREKPKEMMAHPDFANTKYTLIYKSNDNGESWDLVSRLELKQASFLHLAGGVYVVGVSYGSNREPEKGFGGIRIFKVIENGETWGDGVDIIQGGLGGGQPNYHTASSPSIISNGYIYCAFDRFLAPQKTYPKSPAEYPLFLLLFIKCRADKDLLKPENWTSSNGLLLDGAKLPLELFRPPERLEGVARWMEGGMVVTPDGCPCILARVSAGSPDVAALLPIQDGQLTFDYQKDIVRMPGGHHKFVVRRDESTGRYFTLSNWSGPRKKFRRNVLSLCSSEDLRTWKVHHVVLMDQLHDPYSRVSIKTVAFSYADWVYEGEDIIFISRTAYQGAESFHDANRLTFHRIENFRRFVKTEVNCV